MRAWLIPISASLALLGVGVCACLTLLALRADLVCLPQMATAFQGAALARVDRLQATVDALPGQIVAPVVEAARGEVRHGLDQLDTRVGDVSRLLDSRSGQALEIVSGLRADLGPVLVNAAALEADAKDSWDDLYPDVKATVASATVATTSVAYASEAVRDAAPKVAESVVSIGASSQSIAANVAREVDEATKPKKWWQKALGPVYTVGRLIGTFL